MVHAVVQNFGLDRVLRYFSEDKMMNTITVISSVASAIFFRYSGVASFFSFLAVFGTVYHGIIQGVTAFTSDAPVFEIARKVSRAAQLVLYAALIGSSMVLSISAITAISSAFSLYSNLQTSFSAYQIMRKLEVLTLMGGFIIPYTFFFNRVIVRCNAFLQSLNLGNLQQGNNLNLQTILTEALNDYYERNNQAFENIEPVIDFISDERLRMIFEAQLNTLSDEMIRQFQKSRPSVFTFAYLIEKLNEEQVQRIIIPQLTVPESLNNLDALDAIIDMLQDCRNSYQEILDRVNEIDDNISTEDLNALENDVSSRMQNLNQITRDVTQLYHLNQRLQDVPHREDQITLHITEIRAIAAEERFTNLYNELVDSSDHSLRNLYGNLSSRVQARHEDEEDMDEEAYMVLGSVGFRLIDFQTIAPHLNLPADGDSIKNVTEVLATRGISTRRDLIDEQIIILPENLSNELNNKRNQVKSRLIEFINNRQNRMPTVVNAGVVESAYNRLRSISTAINHVYHYTISAMLMIAQIYYQPISTGLGFIYGVYSTNRSSFFRTRILRLWQTSPSYMSQSFTERMRELYLKISIVTNSIFLGPFGGFISGVNHADAIGGYLRRLF